VVKESRRLKRIVARETRGMTTKELLAYFNKPAVRRAEPAPRAPHPVRRPVRSSRKSELAFA